MQNSKIKKITIILSRFQLHAFTLAEFHLFWRVHYQDSLFFITRQATFVQSLIILCRFMYFYAWKSLFKYNLTKTDILTKYCFPLSNIVFLFLIINNINNNNNIYCKINWPSNQMEACWGKVLKISKHTCVLSRREIKWYWTFWREWFCLFCFFFFASFL